MRGSYYISQKQLISTGPHRACAEEGCFVEIPARLVRQVRNLAARIERAQGSHVSQADALSLVLRECPK